MNLEAKTNEIYYRTRLINYIWIQQQLIPPPSVWFFLPGLFFEAHYRIMLLAKDTLEEIKILAIKGDRLS